MICSCGARYPDSDENCGYCGTRNAEYTPPVVVQHDNNAVPHNPWDAFPGAQPVSTEDKESAPWNSEQNENRYKDELQIVANRAANISLVCGICGNIIWGPIFGAVAVYQGRKAKKLGYPGGKATIGTFLGVVAIIFWIVAMFSIRVLVPRYLPELLPYLDRFFLP